MFVQYRPPKADDAANHPRAGVGSACMNQSPVTALLQRWMCTRHLVHKGHHRASIGVEGDLCAVAAEWDNDRTTDKATP